MSGLKRFDLDPADLNPDGIAESQAITAPANMVLDGDLCDAGTALQFDIGDGYSSGIGGIRLLFDSAGDINTNVFTITGKDQDGNSITETVTGVTTAAVSTVKYYSQVTQITPSITTTANVFVGTVTGELVSKTIPINKHAGHPAACAVSGLVGTCQFDLEQTFNDMRTTTGDSAGWFAFSANKSADIAAAATVNATGVRIKFDSYSNGAELQWHVSYNPYK